MIIFFLHGMGGGFGDIGSLSGNPYIATLFGFFFTFPFFLGFLGTLWFGRDYKKIAFFVIIPTFLIDLFWAIDGWKNFIPPFLLSLLFAVAGVIIGFLVKRFLARVHANR
jgi:hypothetical protein